MAAMMVETEIDPRWTNSWERVLSRPSPFGNETGPLPNGIFEPSHELFANIRRDAKILVIGAGGLGCEILKNLALSGLTNIHVIDMDTIDITNLNRQFLFRKKDVGRSKADVAADFIMTRVPGCTVTPYVCAIQDKDPEFYQQFRVVIAGLDNIDARRWLNATLINLVDYEVDSETGENVPIVETMIPLIDGGTEAFAGHARIILPKCTSCFECNIDLFPPPKTFQSWKTAFIPRNAEHCIAYAYMLQWPEVFPNRKIDTDSPEDMQWIYERALERATLFNIAGVTYFKTLGVVKTIIPAVASTNAVIAANCCNEAIKVLSFNAQTINNYFLYLGSDGVYTPSFANERRDDCVVCGDQAMSHPITVSKATCTLQDFMNQLSEDPKFQLKAPSLTSGALTLYFQKPESLRRSVEGNLKKLLSELVSEGDIIHVSDPYLSYNMNIDFEIHFN